MAIRSVQKIIVLCLPGLGNTLMFTPAIRELREAFPDAQIDALTMYRSSYDVLNDNPYLDDVKLFPFRTAGLWPSLTFLRRLPKYDLSIIGYPANRIEYNVISFLIHAKRRLAHRYLRQTARHLSWLNTDLVTENDNYHDIHENLRLVAAAAHRNTVSDSMDMEVFLPYDPAPPPKPVIAIHAGCSKDKNQQARCWPAERFGQLATRLQKDGWGVVVIEGPDDKAIVDELHWHSTPKPEVMENKPVLEVAALLKRCELLLSNDSGIMHLAQAVGTPVVAIFGPTSETYVGPSNGEVVSAGLPCQPCFVYSTKALECKCGDYACLKNISVEDVYRAIQKAMPNP